MKKTRYTITLPKKFDDMISHLAYQEDTSKGEVIRRSVALYAFLHREIRGNGSTLVLRDADGREREIVWVD